MIGNHVDEDQLAGYSGPTTAFNAFANRPKTVRKPDVSFVRADRLTGINSAIGWLRVVPDLVVEVISPNDLAEEVEEKIEMFHQGGSPPDLGRQPDGPDRPDPPGRRVDGDPSRRRRTLGRGCHPRLRLPGGFDFPAEAAGSRQRRVPQA